MRARCRGIRLTPLTTSPSPVVKSRSSLNLIPYIGRFFFVFATNPTFITLNTLSRLIKWLMSYLLLTSQIWIYSHVHQWHVWRTLSTTYADSWSTQLVSLSISSSWPLKLLERQTTLLFYLKLYILSCVMIKDRSCAQLYLLNFTTLQLIITTSMVAKRNKS